MKPVEPLIAGGRIEVPDIQALVTPGLQDQYARLLGYEDHAAFMAGNAATDLLADR